jgi:hypothetical protein
LNSSFAIFYLTNSISSDLNCLLSHKDFLELYSHGPTQRHPHLGWKSCYLQRQAHRHTEFRSPAQSLVKDATAILLNELLYTSPSILSSILLDRLKDNHRNNSVGSSFLNDAQNASILSPGFTDIIANLESMIEHGPVLVTRTKDLSSAADHATPIINKSLIEKAAWLYEDAANRFLELLLIIILVTGGYPSTGDDFLNARIRNSKDFIRGLDIVNGKVHISRTLDDPEHPMMIYRVLPEEVGRMVLLYVADVLPLLCNLPTTKPGFKENTYLFAQGSERWSKERYEVILRRETGKRLGCEMGLEGYEAFHRSWMNPGRIMPLLPLLQPIII